MMRVALVVTVMIIGWSSRYDPGVMQATVEARQAGQTAYDLPANVGHYDGFIAVPQCEHVGDEAWVWFDGVDGWLHVLVADCAVRDNSDGALSWMLDNNILFEIDGTTAARYGYTELGTRGALLSWVEPSMKP